MQSMLGTCYMLLLRLQLSRQQLARLSQSFRMLVLASTVPAIFSSHRIRVCKWVEVGEQLEPFTLLLLLLDTAHSPSSSHVLTKMGSKLLTSSQTKVLAKLLTTSSTKVLTKSKEVAWKETLVGEGASSLVLLVSQLKYLASDLGSKNVQTVKAMRLKNLEHTLLVKGLKSLS